MPAGATRYAGDLQRRHREVGVADRALRGVLLRWLARQPRIEQVAQRRSRHRVLAQLVPRLGGGDTLRGGAEAGGQGTARWQQVRRGALRPGVATLGEKHGGQELAWSGSGFGFGFGFRFGFGLGFGLGLGLG